MIAVDSSALVAILRREPEADDLLRVIAASDCLLSAVTLVEAGIVLAGRTGDATDWAALDALVAEGNMQVVAHDAALADAARLAFLRY